MNTMHNNAELTRYREQITQLESDLCQKEVELEAYKGNIQVLYCALEKSINIINSLEKQLKITEAQMNCSGQLIENVIEKLKSENTKIKTSNDAWIKRSLKLEMELVASGAQNKQLESELTLAIEKVINLERIGKAAKYSSITS